MRKQIRRQYAEKVRELSKFIEPLRAKIAAMGADDAEKLTKVRVMLCRLYAVRLPRCTPPVWARPLIF